mgnify:CR=1 FL=1
MRRLLIHIRVTLMLKMSLRMLNGTYNIICFTIAFAMIPIAKRLGAQKLHFISLLIGGIGLLSMPFLNDVDVLFTIPFGSGIEVSQIYLFSFGLGIAWADMRIQKFIFDHIKMEGDINFTEISQTEEEYKDAFGEDAMDFFEIEI